MTKKYIFLDIDGVLNSVEMAFAGIENCYWYDGINRTSFKLVQTVCKYTGAKIVISSTWRSDGINTIRGAFAAFGWRECSHPYMSTNPIVDVTPQLDGTRGEEIEHWLMAPPHEVDDYVIIDDDSDMTEDQKANHFVHVDSFVGFTIYDAIKAVTILGVLPNFQKEFQDINDQIKQKSRS